MKIWETVIVLFGLFALAAFASWLILLDHRDKRRGDAARLLREKREVEQTLLTMRIEKDRVLRDLKLIDGLLSSGDIRQAQMQLRRTLNVYASAKQRAGPVKNAWMPPDTAA